MSYNVGYICGKKIYMKKQKIRKEPIIGTCLLCGKTDSLVESHIISDFLYDSVKDDYGKIGFEDLADNKFTLLRKGICDNDILCKECDCVRLSEFEDYAARFLRNRIYPSITHGKRQYGVNEIQEEKFVNVDYKKMKLFILSILWRCHVSKQDFCKKVNIPDLEQRIRTMLLRSDPGDESIFPISMIGFVTVTGAYLPMMVTPEVINLNDNYVCRFLMSGVAYFIHLGGVSVSEYKRFCLRETNQLIFPTYSGLQANIKLRTLGVPKDKANYFTFRILKQNGKLISLARAGHFDVLVNLLTCGGKLKPHSRELLDEFGDVEGSDKISYANPVELLGRIECKVIPLNIKERKQFVLVNAYVKRNNGNRRPFDDKAFISVLQQINSRFKGMTVGIINTWAGFSSWDFDHKKVITTIDKELYYCHVEIVAHS